MGHKRCLVLNADFRPIKVIGWQRAMVLSIMGQEVPEEGCEVVEYYPDEVIHSAGGIEYPVPAVMRKIAYIRIKNEGMPVKKRFVYARDMYQCQYCGRDLLPGTLTIDHVISKDEWRKKKLPGNPTNWNNIVTSCKQCNSKKANKPLDKSGLKLAKKPSMPSYNTYINGVMRGKVPEIWKPYLSYK